MSTHAYAGKWIDKAQGKLLAVYIHYDGYPEGLGSTLASEVFFNGYAATHDVLFSEKVGWDALVSREWKFPPIYGNIMNGKITSTKQGYEKIKDMFGAAPELFEQHYRDNKAHLEFCMKPLKNLEIRLHSDNETELETIKIDRDHKYWKEYFVWGNSAPRGYSLNNETPDKTVEDNGKMIAANWAQSVQDIDTYFFYLFNEQNKTLEYFQCAEGLKNLHFFYNVMDLNIQRFIESITTNIIDLSEYWDNKTNEETKLEQV